jgi:hypothetical protein
MRGSVPKIINGDGLKAHSAHGVSDQNATAPHPPTLLLILDPKDVIERRLIKATRVRAAVSKVGTMRITVDNMLVLVRLVSL